MFFLGIGRAPECINPSITSLQKSMKVWNYQTTELMCHVGGSFTQSTSQIPKYDKSGLCK